MTKEDTCYSKIQSDLRYEPRRTVYSEDKQIELPVYEVELFEKPVIVALGKPRYTQKGVFYVPIYLVPSKPQEPKTQIGVYEYAQDRAIHILDADGDLDIDQLTPILYPFAKDVVEHTRTNADEFLSKWETETKKNPESPQPPVEVRDESVSESDDDDQDVFSVSKTLRGTKMNLQKKITDQIVENGVFDIDRNHRSPPPLTPESKREADEIKSRFSESAEHSWIQNFMKNMHYKIHPVEDNGDCFFATVRDAYQQIGYRTTVAHLRAVLARELTDDVYQERRRIFLDFQGSLKEYDQEIMKLKQLNATLQKRSKVAGTKEMDAIRTELEGLKERAEEFKELKELTYAMIQESTGDLTHVNTFEKYQEYVQTHQYWADTWAISTLERVLNMKMIIFSESYYNDGAIHSVMNCGEVNREIQKLERFTPQFYIMTTYSGNHYELVSYQGKKIFTFTEIPYDVKMMIVNKCIEKNAGIYYLIEDFRNFKVKIGIDPDMGSPHYRETNDETEEDTTPLDLFDSRIVFKFFAKSERAAIPGKGSGEEIPSDKVNEYKDLKTIPDWRRILDDTWTDVEHPFVIDGHKYASVVHYYQSAKFRKGFPEFAKQFSLDSDSEISRDVGLARAAGGKHGKVKDKNKKDVVLRPKEAVLDPDFYPSRNRTERQIALRAKFSQDRTRMKVLVRTRLAKLVHYVAKQPPEVDMDLMLLRAELSKERHGSI